jgi:hypothetical protein
MADNNKVTMLEKSNIHRFSNLTCAAQHCGKPLKVGDTIISKKAGSNKTKIKHYHVECFERLYFEA